MRFAEHRRETQKTGGGPPPAPLPRTVADIVDLYKGSSSFVGISGGLETPISKQTSLLFNNSNILVKKKNIYCNPTTPPPLRILPITFQKNLGLFYKCMKTYKDGLISIVF